MYAGTKSRWMLRIGVSYLVFGATLVAGMLVIGRPSMDVYYPRLGGGSKFNSPLVNPAERGLLWLWSAAGWYDATPKICHGDPEFLDPNPTITARPLPPSLRFIHQALSVFVFLIPAFALGILTYHKLTSLRTDKDRKINNCRIS